MNNDSQALGWCTDRGDATPCEEERHSWAHFTSNAVDSYWMRCHRVGPHDEHENSETGARWATPEAAR